MELKIGRELFGKHWGTAGLHPHSLISGLDEVGRGPLAGPVVASAVTIFRAPFQKKLDFFYEIGVRDSKKLTEKRRKAILNSLPIQDPIEIDKVFTLKDEEGEYGIFSLCALSHEVVDQINILQASLLAMKMAYELNIKYLNENINHQFEELVLIDGNQSFATTSMERKSPIYYPLIKGDEKSVVIGLASILAKQYRDEWMGKLAQEYPGYGFEKNRGYPTLKHRQALSELGPTPYHRMTFSF